MSEIISQVVVEVVRAGDSSARVTQVCLEVLRVNSDAASETEAEGVVVCVCAG